MLRETEIEKQIMYHVRKKMYDNLWHTYMTMQSFLKEKQFITRTDYTRFHIHVLFADFLF